jgi:hypothetical protein
MGNVDHVFLEPMAVENLAAGAFHEDAAGFPGFPLVRGKALAGIPKRIFPRGRIPLMIETASRVGPFFISLKRSKEKAMQLTAIGLATALALTSTTAFAMGGGGAGASGGVGSSYASNPAECGGLVCFAKSPSALTAPDPRRKRLRGSWNLRSVIVIPSNLMGARSASRPTPYPR